MLTKHDRWGEPIPHARRTFSIAALFRTMTLTAMLIGWIIVVSKSTAFAPSVLAVSALMLASIAAYRLPGGVLAKLTVFFGFAIGVVFVGGFIPAVLSMLAERNRIEYRTAWGGLDAVYGSCLAVLSIPAAAAVAFWLIQSWVFLANVATAPDDSQPPNDSAGQRVAR
jgi:hypothetical protein